MIESMIEVCAGSVASCIAAERGGADRIELCSALHEGGTTPSYGMVRKAVQAVALPIFPIIRPRGGDFVYSDTEVEVMVEDIKALRAAGAHGFSLGALTADGRLDREINTRLIAACGGLPVTLHRAFDRTQDMAQALETAIEMGFDRILTSGGALTAPDGAETLARLVKQAEGRIIIMAGAGVRPENARNLIKTTGVKEIHGTFSKSVEGRSRYRAGAFPTACQVTVPEYDYNESDEYKIAHTKQEISQ